MQQRLYAAGKAAGIHFACSLMVAALAAGLVFLLWYPYPYRELSGGRELFLLVVAVDVVCGPLLTFVVFNPSKPRSELWRDLSLVAAIQFAALGYGLWTVWQARPVYLVQDVDRFTVVSLAALPPAELTQLPPELAPSTFGGPKTVAIRKPHNLEEKNSVLFSVLDGGRDFAERPGFYLPYEGEAALQSLNRAKPLAGFLNKFPDQADDARKIAAKADKPVEKLVYLPVVSRQDWIAILDEKATVIGFLKGDGF